MSASRSSFFLKEFITGELEHLIERHYNIGENLKKGDDAILIGALCFTGRLQEAQLLFEQFYKKLNLDQQSFCLFSLVVGYTRSSNYQKAKDHLKRLPSGKTFLQKFFYFQSHSFFYYFQGRIDLCQNYADKSLAAAQMSKEIYLRALATDILGHVKIRLGFIEEGLFYLGEALKIAKKIQNISLIKALEVSRLQYICLYGENFTDNFKTLELTFKKLEVTDSYSRSLLGLELARQLNLKGRYIETERILKEISPQILASKNLRYEILFNLRLAELDYLRGDQAAAAQNLRFAERCSEIEGTAIYDSAILGMTLKLQPHMNKLNKNAVTQSLLKLNQTHPSPLSQNTLARQNLIEIDHRQDHFHMLMNLSASNKNLYIQKLYDIGLLTPLRQALDLELQQEFLFLDFTRGLHLLITKKLIVDLRTLGKIPFSILLSLGQGRKNKQQLCETVWNLKYDPLRHDPMIYTAINLLRTSLGVAGYVVETLDEGYCLNQQINIKIENPATPMELNVKNSPKIEMIDSQLNWRQLKGLKLFEQNEWIDVRTYSTKLKVNKLMAARDLRLLYEKKIILRFGQGRATKYCKNNL